MLIFLYLIIYIIIEYLLILMEDVFSVSFNINFMVCDVFNDVCGRDLFLIWMKLWIKIYLNFCVFEFILFRKYSIECCFFGRNDVFYVRFMKYGSFIFCSLN